MSSLDGPDQSDSFPHVHVAVECSRVRHLVFGSRNAQDGLEVTRLPKDPSLWRQSIPTQGPELYTHVQRCDARARMLIAPFHTRASKLTNLYVFDSTADQTARLNRVPGHIEDLQDSRGDRHSGEEAGQHTAL